MPKISGEIARNWLADVPEDKRFWCCDGRVMKNLAELEAALREMDAGTFRYHCNETKCDFGNWVKDVIGDEKLGRDLGRSTSSRQAAASVASRIKWLVKKKV